MSDETSGTCGAAELKRNTPITYDFEDSKQSNPIIIMTVPNSIFESDARLNPSEDSVGDLMKSMSSNENGFDSDDKILYLKT